MKTKEFKKIFFPSISAWLYLALFLSLLANLVYSASLHRPMYHEGVDWYYKILQYQNYYADNQHHRYFDILIQYPAYFYQLFFPSDSPKTVITLLDIGYTFHPLLSLLFCICILHEFNRMELVLFPVLSFFALSLPASLFAVSNGAQMLTVFWPLFLLLLIPEKQTLLNIVFALTLILFLTFTHEAVMFLIPLLLLTAWQKRAQHKIFYIFFFSFCISMAAQIYFLADAAKHNRFGSVLMDINDMNLFHGLTVLIIILFFLLVLSGLASNRKSLLRWFSLTIFILIGIYLIFFLSPYDFYFSRISRIFAAPFGALIGFLVLLIQMKYLEKWRRILSDRPTFLPLFYTFTAIIILYTAADISNTREWEKDTTRFKALLLNKKGCFALSHKESHGYRGFFAALPLFSVIFQEKRDIEVILMEGYLSDYKNQPKGPFYCGVNSTNYYFFSTKGVPIYAEPGLYFNFDKVFEIGNNQSDSF